MDSSRKAIEARLIGTATTVATLPAATATKPSKVAYNVPELCAATGIGKTKIFEAIKSGELPSVFRCGRRLVLKDDLEAWLRGDRTAA